MLTALLGNAKKVGELVLFITSYFSGLHLSCCAIKENKSRSILDFYD
jgi:hypothetical protein